MAISQCFVDSGFSNALIQKQNRTQIDFSTVFYFNIAIGFSIYLLLVLCVPFIASFYDQPLLKDLIPWVGLNVIINSFAVVQRAILTINLDFRKQAVASLYAVSISGAIAIYLAFHGYGVWTLVVQGLLNTCINTLNLWLMSKWKPSFCFSKRSFRDLFSFGSKLMIGSFLHTIYTNLYTLVIGKYFTVNELGLYSKASTLSQFPSNNVSEILYRVFYPVLCKLQNETLILVDKFYLFIRLTAFIVFPLMIGLAVVAEPLVSIVLTEKWLGAVPYIQILCFAYMWYPIMKISWSILNVKHRSDYSLKSEIIKKAIAFIILLATIPLGIKAMCYGLVLYSLADIFIILQFTRLVLYDITIYNHLKQLFPSLLISIIMGVFVWWWIHLMDNTSIQLFGGILIGCVTYIILSYLLNKRDFNHIILLIKKR